MKISVIIPTFNRSQTLSRAIESVLTQSYAAHEVIVVDDGSTDDTEELLSQFADVLVIKQDNKGVSAARNTGIRQASGDWIALLDSDDQWMKEKLAQQVHALQNSDCRLCHTNELWVRDGKHLNQMKKHQKQGGWIFEQCLPMCAISPSASLIKKDLLLEVGLFDETLPACEDYDLWLKICSKEPVLYLEEPLLRKFGGHEDQLSRKYWGMDRFRLQALENILQSDQLNEDQYAKASAVLIKKATVFANGAQKRGRDDDAALYRQLAEKYS